jgi:hypothetical protein
VSTVTPEAPPWVSVPVKIAWLIECVIQPPAR